MRHYSNELEDNHGEVTGFKSACQEFAQKRLSLDERLDIGNPAIFVLRPNQDVPHLGIGKGDSLIFNRSLRPRLNDVILIDGSLSRFTNAGLAQDRVISGVLVAILKSFL